MRKISIIGLGYVGLPLAIAFVKNGFDVIGFDIDSRKIEELKNGIDVTGEAEVEYLGSRNFLITSDVEELKKADFHIVTVPTPINDDHTPDLRPMIGASHTVGRVLKKGDIVVYESTVYPGVTEEVCLPVLEKESSLKGLIDFKVGYSPERINPGDKIHRVENILKIVSGCDAETLKIIAETYGKVIQAGVYQASSIKVAEAAKVIENSQRDINIAFVNELSIIFDKLGINTYEVLEAAGTKWNFLKFKPGLVGGHCIGVDPYYLTHKAEMLGYHSQVILAGRSINDGMGKFIAEKTIKLLFKQQKSLGAKVHILGATFKENVPDIRNSKVFDIVKELKEYGVVPTVSDPYADENHLHHEYGARLTDWNSVAEADVVIFAVEHREYKALKIEDILSKMTKKTPIIIDIKGVYQREEKPKNCIYWSL